MRYGEKEVADWHLQNSNLLDVKQFIPLFLKEIGYENRTASLADLEKLLGNGWFVGVDVSAKTLNRQKGYLSHMVVIFDSDDKHLVLHDPGLPPIPNRKATKKLFLTAWEYAGKETKSLVAFALAN